MGKLDDLEKLQKLKESGVLTEEEFNAEKQQILKANYSESNNVNTDINNNVIKKDMLEIKGDFPFEESKIPLTLLEGERVIIQHKGVMCSGAINDGYITLTNKRILFNKSTGKNLMRAGLVGMALGANRKNEEIEFSKIVSIEAAKYVQGSAGIKIITNDGYTHKYVLQSMNITSKEPNNQRDRIIQLIKSVVKTDSNIELKNKTKINEEQEVISNQIEEDHIKDSLDDKVFSESDNKAKMDKKSSITIKFNHLIIAIILGIVAIIFAVCMNVNKNQSSTKTNTNITSNNDNAVVQKTDNKLSIIDEEKKELKINANELINAIISANKDKAENDRSIYFEYTKKLQQSSDKYNIYSIRKFRYTWYIGRLSVFNC